MLWILIGSQAQRFTFLEVRIWHRKTKKYSKFGTQPWSKFTPRARCGEIHLIKVRTGPVTLQWPFQELDKIVEYELKIGGVLLHPTFSGGKEKDKCVHAQFQSNGCHWATPWRTVSLPSVRPHTFTSPSSTLTRCPGSTTRCSSARPTWWWGW